MGAAAAVFAVCCVLPVGYLIVLATREAVTFNAVLLDARQRGLLANTAILGSGTALAATLIGVPLGVALARIDLPCKPLLRIALAAPLVLPPYIVALAWTYLAPSAYGLPAAVLVLSLVFYPVSMLVTEAAFRRIDGRLEEAGLMAASPEHVLRRITFPLAAPGVFAGALVVFVLAVSDFGVPGLLRVRVYTTEVFTAFAALYDFNRAVLLAMPLLLLCLAVASLAAGWLGDRLVVTRRSMAGPSALLGRWRWVATVTAVTVLSIAVIAPVLILMSEAAAARTLTTVTRASGSATINSLTLAAATATVIVSVAVWIGYARARARSRLGRLADIAFVVSFAVPSTIVGVGLIAVWNRAGVLGAVYGTDMMLLLSYMARFLPVAALVVAAAVRYVPESHEEAAAVAGAGWLRMMVRIVMPQLRAGLAAAWLITFIFAFGELGASILVAPPGEATLPIRIYTIIANTPASHVAALALVQASVIFVPLAVLGAALSLRQGR